MSREDAVEQLSRFKRQVDDLTMRNEDLQKSLTKTKQKLAGSEEQLRKLETKVSASDINIANQVRLMTDGNCTLSTNLFVTCVTGRKPAASRARVTTPDKASE